MKRWGYLKTDVTYRTVAEEVFLAGACRDTLKSLGYRAPETTSVKHVFALGKTRVFDPDKPDDYLKTFSIRKA
jgi:nitrate/nitrite transport system substrate-binding protein